MEQRQDDRQINWAEKAKPSTQQSSTKKSEKNQLKEDSNSEKTGTVLHKRIGNIEILSETGRDGEEVFHICMCGIKVLEGLNYAQARNAKRQITPFMMAMMNAAAVQAIATINQIKPWEKR